MGDRQSRATWWKEPAAKGCSPSCPPSRWPWSSASFPPSVHQSPPVLQKHRRTSMTSSSRVAIIPAFHHSRVLVFTGCLRERCGTPSRLVQTGWLVTLAASSAALAGVVFRDRPGWRCQQPENFGLTTGPSRQPDSAAFFLSYALASFRQPLPYCPWLIR